MHDHSVNVTMLLEQARADRAMLGRLLERYRAYLLLDAKRRLPAQVATRHAPEDVVQATLAEALKAFDRFEGGSEVVFSAWLLRILRCNIIDLTRKYAVGGDRKGPRECAAAGHAADSTMLSWFEPAAEQTTPSQRMIKGEQALRLADILMTLPEDQREAVRMRHLEGCSVDQIAERLDRSAVAAAGLLKRGLKTLRARMREESWMSY